MILFLLGFTKEKWTGEGTRQKEEGVKHKENIKYSHARFELCMTEVMANTVCLPGLQAMWYLIGLIRVIYPRFFGSIWFYPATS